MENPKLVYGISATLVGLIVSIIGMLGYVGYISWAVPFAIVAVGWIIVVAGLVMISLELRSNRSVIEDYYLAGDVREIFSAVPDDDYLVDLTDSADSGVDPLTLEPIAKDEPEFTDMTVKVSE